MVKNNSIHKYIYRLRAYNYFELHNDEIRQNNKINIIMTLNSETKEENQENYIMKKTKLEKS